MDIIIRERRTGKTTELIKRSHESGAYIVVATQREAQRVFQMAKDIGLDIPLPMTYAEFSLKQYGRGVKGVLIDNAESLLQSISVAPVLAITLTKE